MALLDNLNPAGQIAALAAAATLMYETGLKTAFGQEPDQAMRQAGRSALNVACQVDDALGGNLKQETRELLKPTSIV